MKKVVIFIISLIFVYGLNFTKKEQLFLKNHPVIYIAAMKYWPLDKNGDSIHTNYLKLINKYGHINLQPLFYNYWSDAFKDAKNGNVFGILSLSYSKERKKWFYYTPPYNFTPYYIIVNKNSNIHSLKNLKGKDIFIAKNSIIREALKNRGFHIIFTKNAYKKLADDQIDAIMLFYMPKNKYLGRFRIIKTYINRYGEEYLGICKKYPQLYSIINKIVKIIPYKELEKIRNYHYHNIKPIKEMISENVNIFNLLGIKDILVIIIFSLLFIIILFIFFSESFLKMKIKKFFLSVFSIYLLLICIIIYEIAVYNYFSNKILYIKSRSFNSLYLIDKLNLKIVKWNLKYYRNGKIKQISLLNFKIENKPFGNYLNSKYFTDEEIKFISKLVLRFKDLENIQKKVINNKINAVVYKQKLILFIEKLDELRDLIKTHNDKEIQIIKTKIKYQLVLLYIDIVMMIILSVFLFFMMKKKIYSPIKEFTNKIKSKEDLSFYKFSDNEDEISLIKKEIIKLAKQLNNKIAELQEHKKDLEEKIKQEVQIRINQEELLTKQSKLALMGEMIDAVAHQWKQPLNAIYIRVGMILMDKNEINEKYLEEFVDDIYMQIEHMTQTLNEFRHFFREDKEDVFCMKRVVDIVLLLLKDELIRNLIEIEKNVKVNFCIEGNENEFKHLLIALISNAKDIFIQRNIKNRKICINIKEDEKYYYLEIIDNAGGIDEDIKNKIFDVNFTTRKEGTGIGLYLAKKIALKHSGFLLVENVENGAKFIFKIHK